MADEEQSFVLRNPGRRFTIVLWLFFVALSVLVLVTQGTSGKIIGFIGATVFLTFGVLSYRSGIRCDSQGIVALDESGRRRLPWTEIDHFEQRGLKGIGAVVRSGQWVRLMNYVTLGDTSPEKATALLEEQRHKFQSAA